MSNAIDLENIHNAMYSWIASRNLVDAQSIFRDEPNIDRPPTPSISFKIISGPTRIGTRDDTEHDSISDTTTVSGPRNITVSLKSYGQDALQIMTNLHESIELWSVQQYFISQNIAVRDTSGVREISALLETGYEDRAQVDIIFGVSSIQTDQHGAIEHIEITDAIVKDQAGNTVEEITDTIDKP